MNKHLHENEIDIPREMVRKLIDDEFPDFTSLPLTPLASSGSSNIQFRLGSEFLVRLPRQPGGGKGILKEHRWLPIVARHLPPAVPQIIALGSPTKDYEEPWSILRWLDGEHPKAPEPGKSIGSNQGRQLATDLADTILALRAMDVSPEASGDKVLRPYRGRALAVMDEVTRQNIELCKSLEGLDIDLDLALKLWEEAMELPGVHDVLPDEWYHGDLVAENLLLTDGCLSGVLDFGGLGLGDPTIDLHGAWELFDPDAREVFKARLKVDDATWARGRAWALAIALGAISYYWHKMPTRMKDRLAMARAVLADAKT